MTDELKKIVAGESDLQKKLDRLYQNFFENKYISETLGVRMSCPLLISAGVNWENAARKLLVVGQETKWWGPDFSGKYKPSDQAPIPSLIDFLADGKNIERLVEWYKQFDLSNFYPRLSRTPFWQAFKQLANVINSEGQGATLWANLFRCDVDGESIYKNSSPDEVTQVLDFQATLLKQEIAILQPTNVVFFTGPNYDVALKSEFLDAIFEPCIENVTVRQFARVRAAGLPDNTFRTYHPNYLSRAKLWPLIDKICS